MNKAGQPQVISLDGTMTRKEYEDRLSALRACYPFIPANAILDPTPGCLKPLEKFLGRLNRAIGDHGLAFLEVREADPGRVNVHLDPSKKLPLGRAEAIDQAQKEFRHACGVRCRLCGTEIPDEAFYSRSSGFCGAHEELGSKGARLYEDAARVMSEIISIQSKVVAVETADDETQQTDFLECDLDDEGVYEVDDELPMTVAVFDPTKIDALEKWGKGRGDRDSKQRIEHLVRELRKTDGYRKLATLPPDWDDRLDGLEKAFPNFSDFFDFLRYQFALYDSASACIAFSPVILNGPPGIGKSEVLTHLAELLWLPEPLFLDFSTSQSASQLTGSAAYWSNSHESEIFRKVVFGEYPNQIVFVDEIEKASGEGRYNPQTALYSLLEASRAAQFQDLSLTDFPINASHLNWVAAGNDAQKMDAPLRSRFTILEIPAPTRQQMRMIHASIFGEFIDLTHWGRGFSPLSESTLDALTGMSPREAKNLLRIGAGRARYKGRNEVLPEDVQTFRPGKRLAAGFVSDLATQ